MASYNIRPVANKKFQVAKVQQLVKSIVDNECSKIEYDENTAKLFPEKLSVMLINKLKLNELEFGSYKYIVNVIIGERRGSGIHGTSKCYFDTDSDACVTYTYISNSSSQQKSAIFCIVTVFGIYYY